MSALSIQGRFAEIEANRYTKEQVDALLYIPLPPSADGDGYVETFAKYNFSYVLKGKVFYPTDNDGVNWILFIANDGDQTKTAIFVAMDISQEPSGVTLKYSNQPIIVSGIPDGVKPIEINACYKNYFVLVGDNGIWYKVTTNGDYINRQNWVATLITAPTSNYCSVAVDDSGFTIVARGGAAIKVYSNDILVSTVSCWSPAMIDMSSMTNSYGALTSSSIAYGYGSMCDGDNDSYWMSTIAIFWFGTIYTVNTFLCKFKLDTAGNVVWIVDPSTAGYALGTNDDVQFINGADHHSLNYNPFTNKYTKLSTNVFADWSGISARYDETLPAHQTTSKVFQIPDTSPVSKSATPGYYVELNQGPNGGVYALRAATDSSGLNITVALYKLAGDTPKAVPGGLPGGETYKKITSVAIDSTRWSCSKFNGSNEFVYLKNDSVVSIKFDPAINDLSETVLTTLVPANYPSGYVFHGFVYDHSTSTLYIQFYQNVIGGEAVLYKLNADKTLSVEMVIPFAKTTTNRPHIPNQSNAYMNCDDPNKEISLPHALSQPGGTSGTSSVHYITTQESIGERGHPYPYASSSGWSSLVDRFYESNGNGDAKTPMLLISEVDRISHERTLYLGLAPAEGLNGFVNNGAIFIGGYSTTIHESLVAAGNATTFTIPPNAVSYLYLIREGRRGLRIKVSQILEANTFYKVLITKITTNATAVTSTVNYKVTGGL
jgi:hypothetical protein